MQDEDSWGAPVSSPTPLTKQMIDSKKKLSVELPLLYRINFSEVETPARVDSSILESGYVEGTFVLLIGPPGTGKSRFALQECIAASMSPSPKDSLYLYNETVKIKFDSFVKTICEKMQIRDDSDLSHITFCDMSKFLLRTADYDSIKNFAQRVWAGTVEQWLNQKKRNPAFVVIDSISNIGRRYIPQLTVLNKDLTEALVDVYKKHNVKPVTFFIHQKSLSPRENNTDSVVGGYGLVHEGDMSIILKLHDVNRWDADRYGWQEGQMVHTLQIAKDRYSTTDFKESIVFINKRGFLQLGQNIHAMHEEVKENKKVLAESDWP